MKDLNDAMIFFTRNQTMLNHEKERYSLRNKANTEAIKALYDKRTKTAKVLTAQLYEQMQNEIRSQGSTLQVLYYDNTRNKLLGKDKRQKWS
jgi:regulator of protease activity HflC (stomatin/prohibitin superfamily)